MLTEKNIYIGDSVINEYRMCNIRPDTATRVDCLHINTETRDYYKRWPAVQRP